MTEGTKNTREKEYDKNYTKEGRRETLPNFFKNKDVKERELL